MLERIMIQTSKMVPLMQTSGICTLTGFINNTLQPYLIKMPLIKMAASVTLAMEEVQKK